MRVECGVWSCSNGDSISKETNGYIVQQEVKESCIRNTCQEIERKKLHTPHEHPLRAPSVGAVFFGGLANELICGIMSKTKEEASMTVMFHAAAISAMAEVSGFES